jgi:SulP family sulfate permease
MKKMSEISKEQSSGNKLRDIPLQIEVSAKDAVTAELAASSIADILSQQVYIKDLQGPLFFGFTNHFQNMLMAIPEVKVVILRMRHVPYIDQSGLYAIEDALLYLSGKNIQVAIVGLQTEPEDMLRRIDIIPGLIPEDLLFKDMSDCLKWLESHFA